MKVQFGSAGFPVCRRLMALDICADVGWLFRQDIVVLLSIKMIMFWVLMIICCLGYFYKMKKDVCAFSMHPLSAEKCCWHFLYLYPATKQPLFRPCSQHKQGQLYHPLTAVCCVTSCKQWWHWGINSPYLSVRMSVSVSHFLRHTFYFAIT